MALISAPTEGASLESLARELSPKDVGDFLTEIGLAQYTETFKASRISGKMLLGMNLEVWLELGVTSALHQMKISQLFRWKLQD